MKLLNIDRNAKTKKGQKKGYLTGIIYMAPAKLSGYEVCPMRTPGCTAACLNTAGMGIYSKVQESRIKKTKWFFEDRPAFMLQLEKEIEAFIKQAQKKDMIPVIRLNGTSDILWERCSFLGKDGKHYNNIMERFPDQTFYDYTKIYNRKNLPKNYSLTFSLAENNQSNALKALQNNINVAIVFDKPPFPKEYWGYSVYDGDEDDLRFLDLKGIIALKAKGKARKDTSGFVRKSNEIARRCYLGPQTSGFESLTL